MVTRGCWGTLGESLRGAESPQKDMAGWIVIVR